MEESSICFSTSETNDTNDTGESNNEDNVFVQHRSCVKTRICLIGDLQNDDRIVEAAKTFDVPIVFSETGSEFLNDGSCDTIFVTREFGGPVFDAIHQSEQRIVGPTVLLDCAEKKDDIPKNSRPQYCRAMLGLNICFTGFRKREDLNRLMQLIHFMGGSIRKDMGSKITHLIANSRGGDKYLYAATFRVPIMSEAWVHACWEQRNVVGMSAVSPEMMSYKHKPFYSAFVSFFGFPEEEREHMTEVLLENGGVAVDLEDPTCTHVVVDESAVQNVPEKTPAKAFVVKVEWFWSSVQNEACAAEKEYLFEDYLEELMSPQGKISSSPQSASSASRARKRKRLRDGVRLVESPSIHKRRSSVSDAAFLSMSGSFLDCSTNSEKGALQNLELDSSIVTPQKGASPRHQVFLELVQTEQNYVGILHTIMMLFKDPLEEMTEKGDTLLNNTELKIIFGNLPPIYEVHSNMLLELRETALHWKEESSIGKIILKYHTSKSNADHSALEQALGAVREVMTHINEDKRRTEGQLVIFDIFNEIENCPPLLVSSHRSFIVRCDVIELADGLSGRGDSLVFFLFSDTMEVCKKRSKAFKSPNVTGSLHSMKMTKPYKHICLLPLSTIKRVIDIQETNDCRNAFCLRCRNNQEFSERQYSFAMADEEADKMSFLRTLCRQIANTVCRTDTESFFSTQDSSALDLDTSDVVYGSLSKAFKRTKQKVGRAFSFNKTPSKLKRAVSTMMSPFGSTSNLTPASQLAQMRLASCNNLNELGTSPVKSETSYVAPMSVQPTRKNKAPPLNDCGPKGLTLQSPRTNNFSSSNSDHWFVVVLNFRTVVPCVKYFVVQANKHFSKKLSEYI
ncbi:Guanine nucleotide exchange factor-like protein [Gryllus bimaculatus]|nr:Guanine nucleotide exchange factor-like protein [Gryllus bimaculatus]